MYFTANITVLLAIMFICFVCGAIIGLCAGNKKDKAEEKPEEK